MNVKLKVLSAGVLFFIGSQVVEAQKTKKDSLKTKDIEDVVLVGYTAVKKDDFSGAVTKVANTAIKNKSVSNATQALAGEAAGVRIINSTGQPGSSPTIRIRGFGSVNGNREPLIVLDGVPYEGYLSSINPEDIENFNILKDASATAIYGSRGANGVILITTKRGRSNRDQITLESKIGFNSPLIPRYNVIDNPEEYIGLGWEALYNYAVLSKQADPEAWANANLFGEKLGIASHYNLWNVSNVSELIDPVTRKVRPGVTRKYTPERWKDYAFQTSVRSEHNLNISGGAGKTTYYSSIGYLKDEGYSINSKYERYSGRLNVSHQAKSWLKGEFNLGYAHSKTDANGQSANSNSVFWFVDNIPSIYPLFLRDADGNKIADPHYGGYIYDYGDNQIGNKRRFGALTNSISYALHNMINTKRHEINANFFLKADLAKGLSFETRLGGQYFNNSQNTYENPFYGSSVSRKGYLYKYKLETFSWNFLQMLRYMNRFGKHNVQAFAAHETTKWERSKLEANKYGLIIPDGKELNNAIKGSPAGSYMEDYGLESYFGQVMYDYSGKYSLQASVRRDGSSRFLIDKWDTFYSTGLGWLVSKEEFLKGSHFLPYLKLRASYGTVGDQEGIGFYSGYDIYTAGNFMGLPGAAFERVGYPKLTWEKSKMYQGGVDFKLFKNRIIEASLDYYYKTTDNLIFDNRLAPSTGNAIIKVNDGLLLNRGIEFTLKGNIVNNDSFFLNLSVNGEWVNNKITQMPVDLTTGKQKIIDTSDSAFGRVAGRSLYDFYLRDWAGVNPDTGAGRWVLNYVDKNNNDEYDSGDTAISSMHEFLHENPNAIIKETLTENYNLATQKFVNKSAIPDLRGAFALNTGYKGLSLSIQFLYGIGGYSYDGAYASLMRNGLIGGNNWHRDIHKRWQKKGDITDVPRLSNNKAGDTNFTSLSSRFLTKSDYLALNNVHLSYSLPSKYFEGTTLRGLTLSVSGDNLWLSTKRIGFNPTASETGNSNMYRYSPLSTVTFGVKVNF